MRLRKLILENFRAYRERTEVEFGSLTAFIGKNDYGKSSILEALEIFFNNSTVKIEKDDASAGGEGNQIRIGVVLDELPDSLVLDRNAQTNLAEEFLLNGDDHLELHKLFTCGSSKPTEEVFVTAHHPVTDSTGPLLLKKNSALKDLVRAEGIDEATVDLRNNSAMRKALWAARSEPLAFEDVEIPLNEEDGKTVWNVLKKALPTFALFQSDRPCKDDDDQVQDPMKLAVKEALRAVEADLDRIAEEVRQKATEVAKRTVDKLAEMDATLAQGLKPVFKKEPGWATLFKLSLTGDDDIPINKRGSGVRRLILLNFFIVHPYLF